MVLSAFHPTFRPEVGTPALMVYGRNESELDNESDGWVLSQILYLNQTEALDFVSSVYGHSIACHPQGELIVVPPAHAAGFVAFKLIEVAEGSKAASEIDSTSLSLPFTWQYSQQVLVSDNSAVNEPIILSNDGLQIILGDQSFNGGAGRMLIFTASDQSSNFTLQETFEPHLLGGVQAQWGNRMFLSQDQSTLVVGCLEDALFSVFGLSDVNNSSSWRLIFESESDHMYYGDCALSLVTNEDGTAIYTMVPRDHGRVAVWRMREDLREEHTGEGERGEYAEIGERKTRRGGNLVVYEEEESLSVTPPNPPIPHQHLSYCGCSMARTSTYRPGQKDAHSTVVAFQCGIDGLVDSHPRKFGLTFVFTRQGSNPYVQTNTLFPSTLSPNLAGDIAGVFMADPLTGMLVSSTKKALYNVGHDISPVNIYNGTYCFGGSFLADELDQFNCTLCPRGTASDLFGAASASVCQPCDAGLYSSSLGSLNCTSCAVGTFSEAPGYSACDFCFPGTFADSTGLTACRECVPGKSTSSSKSSTCNDCETGKFGSKMGMSVCQDCAAGSFSNVTGRDTPCTACESGSFSQAGQVACELCHPGSFATNQGASTCDACAVGSAFGGIGLKVPCPLCELGTFSDEEGTTSCRKCEMGTYAPENGLSSCVNCPSGRFSNTTGGVKLDDCVMCSKGSVARVGGSSKCFPCGFGRYADAIGLSTCTACSAGRFLAFRGADSKDDCNACQLGRFADDDGRSSCTNCTAGRYAAEVGTVDCTACEAGTASPVEGGTSEGVCTPCGPGSFSPDLGSIVCSVCPVGRYCPSDRNTQPVPCGAGTFNNEEGSTSDSACRECPAGQYCPFTPDGNEGGINCTNDHYCPAGSDGPKRCSQCLRDEFILHNCNSTHDIVCSSLNVGGHESTPWYELREVYTSVGSVCLSLFFIILYWFWHRYRRSQHPLPNHVYKKLRLNFGDFTSGYGILFVKFVLEVQNDVLRKAEIASIDEKLFVNCMCMALEELDLVEHRGKYCFVCPKYPFCGRFIHERSLHDSSTVDAVSDCVITMLQDSRVGLLSLYNTPADGVSRRESVIDDLLVDPDATRFGSMVQPAGEDSGLTSRFFSMSDVEANKHLDEPTSPKQEEADIERRGERSPSV